MSQLSRKLQRIFGDTGGTSEFGQIGSKAAGSPATTKDLDTMQSLTEYLQGYLAIVSDQGTAQLPYSEDLNSLFFLATTQLAYLFQNGIPEWLNSTDQRYYANVSFVTKNQKIFMAILGDDASNINAQKDPETETTWWREILNGSSIYSTPLPFSENTIETELGADSDDDVIFKAGHCVDSTGKINLILGANIEKQIDAVWVEGDASGGNFVTGTPTANDTYYGFVIRKDSDGTIDAGFDTDPNCGNCPSGWSVFRYVASFRLDSSSNIYPYTQYGDIFVSNVDRTSIFVDISGTQPTTETFVDLLTVPEGFNFEVQFVVSGNSGGTVHYAFAGAGDILYVPNTTYNDFFTYNGAGSNKSNMRRITNTSAQIRYRANSAGALNGGNIFVQKWVDLKRRAA